jgi:hypothetical protein
MDYDCARCLHSSTQSPSVSESKPTEQSSGQKHTPDDTRPRHKRSPDSDLVSGPADSIAKVEKVDYLSGLREVLDEYAQMRR